MVAIQTQTMSPQRKKITVLVEQVAEWKKEYNKENNLQKQELKAIHNHLCDTLDACNDWLLKHEGEYCDKGGVTTGEILKTWSEI